MIAPTGRLVALFGLIAIPALTAVALTGPVWTPIWLSLIAAVGIVAVADLWLSVRRRSDFSVSTDGEVRMVTDMPHTVALALRVPEHLRTRMQVGLAWPDSFDVTDPAATALLRGEPEVVVEWQVTPTQRGRWQLDRVYARLESGWRLWSLRATAPAQIDLRVYPNLASERQVLAPLLLRRQTLGMHTIRQVGQGREFEKLRDYVPGDSYEDVHWKATAKRGHPVTKVYQIERTQEIYLIVDASRLSGRPIGKSSGDGETRVIERLIKSALVLSLAVEREGDLTGLCTFSDGVRDFIRARSGQAHYQTIRDALYTLEARPVTPDFDELFAFLRTRVRRRGLMIFLTALDDPMIAESFVRNVQLLARQHLVMVNMVRPPGMQPLFSDPDVGSVAAIYDALGGHHRWAAIAETERTLAHRGVDFHLIEDERFSASLVSQYLRVKRQQLI